MQHGNQPGLFEHHSSSLLNTPSGQIVQKLVGLWPAPNVPGAALSNNYFASGPFAFDRHTLDTKINWNVSNKFSVFGRFSFLHYSDFTPTVFGEALVGRPIGGSSNPGHGHGETYNTTFGGVYTLKPNFVIDAYFGLTGRAPVPSRRGSARISAATFWGFRAPTDLAI